MWKLLNLLPGRRRRMDHELEKELRYHIDRRVDDLRAKRSERSGRAPAGGARIRRRHPDPRGRSRHLAVALAGQRLTRSAVCRPAPAPQSRLRRHGAPVDRAGHRLQCRGVFADRSGAAASAAGQRAGSSGALQLEGRHALVRLWLQLPEFISAVPRARGTAAGLRWRRLPSSFHRQSLDRTAAATGACRDRVGRLFHCSRRAAAARAADRCLG